MRSMRRHLPYLSLVLACSITAAVLMTLRVHAASSGAPTAAGAVGGDWQTVDVPSLSGQRITALLPDARGGLWVGAEERGLAAWDGKRWRAFGPRDGLPDSRVVALFLDRQHRLWVSSGVGLAYLPAGSGRFRQLELHGLRSLPVLAFAQAPDGAILLGGTKGLDRWQQDRPLVSIAEFNDLAVLALHADRDGVIWAGTSAGLWRGVDGRWQREPGPGAGRVVAIAEGPDGRFLVAGESGLWQEEAGGWRRLSSPASGEMTAAAVRDGSVWVGTSQGVVAGQGDVWEIYDAGFLPQAMVTALAWDSDGALWVGTAGGLVAHRPDSAPPRVAIVSVNGLRPESGSVRLGSDRIDQVRIDIEDRVTPANRLRIFTRLEGVDPAPRLLSQPEMRDPGRISVYAGQTLAPGSYGLRAWAQDDAFNRSAESLVQVIVPPLAHGPGGVTVRQDAAFAGMAVITLIVTAGATTRVASRTRRRQAEHEARAAEARVRAVADQSEELYSERLPLRQEQVNEVTSALRTQNVLLLGAPGMGKTSTLSEVAAALSSASERSQLVAPASVDLATVGKQELFAALMGAATDALYPFAAGPRLRLRWSEGGRPDYGEQEFSADLGVLLASLQSQLGRRPVLVFLLDNAGALDGYEGGQRDAFRRLLVAASAASSPIRLALAAERAPDAIAGFLDLFRTVLLAPLDASAASRLLRQGARGLLEWEPDAEQVAITRAAGSPSQLTALGRAAARCALANRRLCISSSDVP